eukprot:6071325-Pyramimonas_sp.AAC.1
MKDFVTIKAVEVCSATAESSLRWHARGVALLSQDTAPPGAVKEIIENGKAEIDNVASAMRRMQGFIEDAA